MSKVHKKTFKRKNQKHKYYDWLRKKQFKKKIPLEERYIKKPTPVHHTKKIVKKH